MDLLEKIVQEEGLEVVQAKLNRIKKKKILDKDKLILVFYVGIGNMNDQDAKDYMQKIQNQIGEADESVIRYFIPIRDSESKVESINPTYIGKDEYDKVQKVLSEAQGSLESALENTEITEEKLEQ